jgi:EAL domain-containing protein (putative c-di-GMP-specific phosphodiesterase class I)
MAGSAPQGEGSAIGRAPAGGCSEPPPPRHDHLDSHNDLSDQVRLVYQPVVNTEDHRIVAAEAFVRWSHPRLGDTEPEVLLPAAVRSGLTGALTAQVLKTACAQLVDWKTTGKLAADALVAVNLSADDLVDPNLVTSVRDALDGAGLDPRYLAVEVTEMGLAPSPATALARLQVLRRLGARIAIDGFGTGYSSLAYLKPPIEAVKLDKSWSSGWDATPKPLRWSGAYSP